MTKHCTKPCVKCPFRKDIEPGYTGGSHPTVFIGQAHGPFLLACHAAEGYDTETVDASSVQCAGAAIFRANIGVSERMPPQIHSLPADKETVFGSEAEFLAHHKGYSMETAKFFLEEVTTPVELAQIELRKSEVRRLI